MSLEQSKPVIDNVIAALAATSGGHGGGWGVVTAKDTDKFLIIVGWDSVDAHAQFGGTEAFNTIVFPGIMSITPKMKSVSYWHVPLEKH